MPLGVILLLVLLLAVLLFALSLEWEKRCVFQGHLATNSSHSSRVLPPPLPCSTPPSITKQSLQVSPQDAASDGWEVSNAIESVDSGTNTTGQRRAWAATMTDTDTWRTGTVGLDRWRHIPKPNS